MGLTQSIRFPAGVPSWKTLRERLAQHGLVVQMRMIDGQIAFPDEEPPDDWRELRISLPQGMITLQRQSEEIAFVIWGNSDPTLVQSWQAVVKACGEA